MMHVKCVHPHSTCVSPLGSYVMLAVDTSVPVLQELPLTRTAAWVFFSVPLLP